MENDKTSQKSFSNLTNTYISRATNTDFSNADTSLLALSFLRFGRYIYDSGALNRRGTNGYYWSLRGYSGIYANSLAFYSANVYPQYGDLRGLGYALRCLAR